MEKDYKKIPGKKPTFITLEGSRKLRIKLAQALLRKLEGEIIKEAFKRIAERGLEIWVTDDPQTYKRDLKAIANGDETVYLLIDKGKVLQDFSPLLPFVSRERKAAYKNILNTLSYQPSF